MSAAPLPMSGSRPRPGAFDDAADELRIARSPHEVRSHDDDGEARCVGGEREEFPCGFRARVVSASPGGVGGAGRIAHERRARVRDGRRRDMHDAPHAGGARLGEQRAGAADVDAIEFGDRARQRDFRGEMHDGIDALDRCAHAHGIRHIAQHVDGARDVPTGAAAACAPRGRGPRAPTRPHRRGSRSLP